MEFLLWSFYVALLCAATVQASYLLQAIDTTTYATWRVWYGDGRAYTGPTIPPDVKVAVNFTIDDSRNQFFFTDVDHANSAPGAQDFANPTFLVVNAGAAATDTIYFAHSAVNFTQGNIFFWGGIEGLVFPMTWSSMAAGKPYLVPTSAPDTYAVRWIVNTTLAAALNGQEVTLRLADL